MQKEKPHETICTYVDSPDIRVNGSSLPLMLKAKPRKTQAAHQKELFISIPIKALAVNHFAPSGWMGDYGDLKIDDAIDDPDR